jgi:hypothetical protein
MGVASGSGPGHPRARFGRVRQVPTGVSEWTASRGTGGVLPALIDPQSGAEHAFLAGGHTVAQSAARGGMAGVSFDGVGYVAASLVASDVASARVSATGGFHPGLPGSGDDGAAMAPMARGLACLGHGDPEHRGSRGSDRAISDDPPGTGSSLWPANCDRLGSWRDGDWVRPLSH